MAAHLLPRDASVITYTPGKRVTGNENRLQLAYKKVWRRRKRPGQEPMKLWSQSSCFMSRRQGSTHLRSAHRSEAGRALPDCCRDA